MISDSNTATTAVFTPPVADLSIFGDNIDVARAAVDDLQAHLEPHVRVTLEDLTCAAAFFTALGFDVRRERIPFRALIDNVDAKETWKAANEGFEGGVNRTGLFWDLAVSLIELNAGVPEDGEPPRGIYFTVHKTNGYGAKNVDIVAARALFFDEDFSDDKSRLDLGELHKKAPLNAIVRTKNGHHGYWVLDEGPDTVHEIGPRQLALAKHLKTDETVTDHARIMRVPGFNHWKGEPFKVHALHVEMPET